MVDYNLSLTIQSILTISRILLDISIVWFVLYYAIRIIRNNSRTIQIFKGIVLIILIDITAKFFGFQTVGQISSMFMNWGFLAVIIIFQPELRSILEKIGKTNVFSRISNLSGNEKEHLVDELVKATMILSENQTGALISIEQSQSLQDYIRTGVTLNSNVTAELLTSLFVTSTPLHDGAVIVQGDKLACASAYFPPTNLEVANKYGARHRAAIGISEISDCVTIVVSEETGSVSIAEKGVLKTVNKNALKEYLLRIICNEETEVRKSKIDGTSNNIFVLDDSTVEIEIEKPEEKAKIKDKLFIKRQRIVDGKERPSIFKRKQKEAVTIEPIVDQPVKKIETSEIEQSEMKLPKKKKEMKIETIEVAEISEPIKEEIEVEAEKKVVTDKTKAQKEVKQKEIKNEDNDDHAIAFDDENDSDMASQFALIDSDEEVLEIRSGQDINAQDKQVAHEKGVNAHDE